MVIPLLLVEDDATIGAALCDALRKHRYDVRWCRDGRAALAASTGDTTVAVALVDLGLPDLDGVDVCRELRTRFRDAVIVILTARDAEIDIVVGLEAGADDYLTKPIRVTELLARLRAHLRRAAPASTDTVVVGALRVDGTARRCWLGDRELVLRAKEFDLLARLAAEPTAALSRGTLMSDVWDDHWHGSTKTLDVHIAVVRRKLDDAARATGRRAPSISTLRGFGYRLDPDDG